MTLPVGRKQLSLLVHRREALEFCCVHGCGTELTKLGLHLFETFMLSVHALEIGETLYIPRS